VTQPKAQLQQTPPPVPVPKASNAAQARDQQEEDLRKKRNSTASSYMTGNTAVGAGSPAGSSYFG